MYKFMFLTFGFLGWAFWELSGGSDFVPPASANEQAGVLDTYDVDQTTANLRTRLTATGNAPEVTQAAVVTQDPIAPAGNNAAVPTETDTNDPTIDTTSLSSGVAALTADEDAETFTPTTTAAISVEPMANPVTTQIITTADIRTVIATRVNMRNGPSTDFQVLDQLENGERVEVIDNPGAGWVQLRVERSGQVGWMAERLLTPAGN